MRGFSILFVPAAGGFALLEYMAVAPDQRNHGLGAELFRQTVEQAVTPDDRKLPVLLEVDSDREASSDRALRTRRERFYRRLGCLRIAGLRYLMPLGGEGAPPEMDLLVYRSGAARQPGAERGQTLARDHLSRRLSLPAGRSAPRADGGRPARSRTARLNEEGEPTWRVEPPP